MGWEIEKAPMPLLGNKPQLLHLWYLTLLNELPRFIWYNISQLAAKFDFYFPSKSTLMYVLLTCHLFHIWACVDGSKVKYL